MRYTKIIGLLILLTQVSCTDNIKSKTSYKLDRAGNPEYKEEECQYIDGKTAEGKDTVIRHGLTKEFYADGQVKTEVAYVDGEITGEVKTYFENGQISEQSSWSKGLRNGNAKYYYDNGNLFREEYFKDGQANGEQKTFFENGKLKTTVVYKDDLPWQVVTTHDTSGNTLDALTLNHGRGIWNSYYPSGKLKSQITYDHGKPNGKSKWFFESGEEQGSLTFSDGKKNGELIFYHPNGRLAKETTFKNDFVAGTDKTYNPNGILISEVTYKENLTPKDIEKLKSGILQTVSETLDPFGLNVGIMNGPCKTYYDNGRLQSEQYFRDGRQDSLFREYYDNGVMKTDLYIDERYEFNMRYERRYNKAGKPTLSQIFHISASKELDKLLDGTADN